MRKRVLLLALVFALLFTSSHVVAAEKSEAVVTNQSVVAAEEPVIYKDTITVTQDGGRYQIGFIEVEFKKDWLEADKLPVTFEVKIYAENGKGYIEFSPDIPHFIKKVHIRVDDYKGLLYDVAKGENIYVNYKHKNFTVEHFSRFCFSRY